MEIIGGILEEVVAWSILLFEIIGVLVLITAGIKGFICYVKGNPDTRLILAKGMAMGLEFKLGSEILRTVIVREWSEIGFVAGIVGLRAVLTFLIDWEIKEEEKRSQG